MSGGAFDYKDNTLFELKDDLAKEIGLAEYGCRNVGCNDYSPKTIKYMKVLCNDLGNIADIMHSLDWFLSGDTSEEQFIADFEKLYYGKEIK